METQIILLSQKFSFKKLSDQFPASGNPFKKIFFQSELRSIKNGTATFAVIAYPAWKGRKGRWVVGTKIDGEETGGSSPIPLTGPIAFANTELLFTTKADKKIKRVKKIKKNRCKENAPGVNFRKLIKEIFRNSDLAKKSFFTFTPSISENPHIEFDVTLDAGGTLETARANPCPPAKPAEEQA